MISRLRELVQEYSYGKTHLLNESITIEIDPTKKYGKISPFRRTGPSIREGDCGELTDSLCMRLKSEFPALYVISTQGNDPSYFTTSAILADGERIGNHWYLIVTENEGLMTATPSNFSDPAFLQTMQPIVVDPSLRFAGDYETSQYSIGKICSTQNLEPWEKPYEFHEPRTSTPLGITKEKSIISLFSDFSESEVLLIEDSFPSRKDGLPEKNIFYRMGSVGLKNRLKSNPKLLELVDYLSDKNPLHTNPSI